MPDLRIDAQYFGGLEDFTFFLTRAELENAFAKEMPDGLSQNKKQWDETVVLAPRGVNASLQGRLNVSSCFCGNYVSCSFRATSSIPDASEPYHKQAYKIEDSNYNPAPQSRASSEEQIHVSTNAGALESHLSSMELLCDMIYKRIFPSLSGAHGLIVVAGATATGKSRVARGVIYKYLRTLLSNEEGTRRPHLVTFEDPVDKRWADNPAAATLTGIDYTPRELNKDVLSLEDAIKAALRQTPKVFFVGETRDPNNWKALLRFASTGHLCVTTSHAGSLTEAMGQLLRAAEADSAARRSWTANQVLALIHLRSKRLPHPKGSGYKDLNITIPSIWVRSPVSTKTLMADGLTALLPYRDLSGPNDENGTAGKLGCLGRSWFADQLLEKAPAEMYSDFAAEVRKFALTWDLEGI